MALGLDTTGITQVLAISYAVCLLRLIARVIFEKWLDQQLHGDVGGRKWQLLSGNTSVFLVYVEFTRNLD